MADPLSIAASIAGLIGLTATTARTLISLTQEMVDAPEEIVHVRRDVQNLTAILNSVQEVCGRYDLQSEDLALVDSLAEYLDMCQDSMRSLRELLRRFVGRDMGRRSPMRMIGWTMRKGEIKGLRVRLQESKASLNITVSALNGLLEGKGHDEIRNDVSKLYDRLVSEFQSLDHGKRVRRRVEDDVASVSNFGRRPSMSELTDAAFPLNRYFEQLQPPSKLDLLPDKQVARLSIPNSSPFYGRPDESLTLMEAVRTRNREGVLRLLTSDTLRTERTQDGYTVLHLCAIYNDPDTAKLLIDHGADINARDDQLRSPLNIALSSEAMDTASLLVERGCSLNGSIGFFSTLAQRREEILGYRKLLRELATRLNKSSNGPFLIHQAIETNDKNSLGVFLSAGFDPNARDSYGIPPLYQAMMQQRKQAIRILLDNGVNVNDMIPPKTADMLDEDIPWQAQLAKMTVSTGIQPLAVAARTLNDPGLVRLLLSNGADPNFVNPLNGGVMLSGICSEEYLEVAEIVIKAGANVNHKSVNGDGPLRWANTCNNPRLMDIMLDHGGDLNRGSGLKLPTILHVAAYRGRKGICEVLLKHGADLDAKNDSGKTPLDLAREEKKEEVVKFLVRAMADRKRGGS